MDEFLGRGSTGVVWAATSRESGERVAAEGARTGGRCGRPRRRRPRGVTGATRVRSARARRARPGRARRRSRGAGHGARGRRQPSRRRDDPWGAAVGRGGDGPDAAGHGTGRAARGGCRARGRVPGQRALHDGRPTHARRPLLGVAGRRRVAATLAGDVRVRGAGGGAGPSAGSGQRRLVAGRSGLVRPDRGPDAAALGGRPALGPGHGRRRDGRPRRGGVRERDGRRRHGRGRAGADAAPGPDAGRRPGGAADGGGGGPRPLPRGGAGAGRTGRAPSRPGRGGHDPDPTRGRRDPVAGRAARCGTGGAPSRTTRAPTPAGAGVAGPVGEGKRILGDGGVERRVLVAVTAGRRRVGRTRPGRRDAGVAAPDRGATGGSHDIGRRHPTGYLSGPPVGRVDGLGGGVVGRSPGSTAEPSRPVCRPVCSTGEGPGRTVERVGRRRRERSCRPCGGWSHRYRGERSCRHRGGDRWDPDGQRHGVERRRRSRSGRGPTAACGCPSNGADGRRPGGPGQRRADRVERLRERRPDGDAVARAGPALRRAGFTVRSAEVVNVGPTTVVLRAVVDRSAYLVVGAGGAGAGAVGTGATAMGGGGSQSIGPGPGVPLRYTLSATDGAWRLTEVGPP